VIKQREEPLSLRRVLACGRELENERHFFLVQGKQCFGFAQWFFDLQGDGFWPGAVDRHEVGGLAVLAADHAAGQLGCVGMNVGVGIADIAIARCGCSGQSMAHRKVDNDSKFLLAIVAARPHLARLWQEYAADQRCQPLVVLRHLVQGRV
jgi:hypothetical protein